MESSENKVDGIIVVSLGGRIDSTAAVEFEEELIQTIDAGAKTMVVDFQEVQFISSAGLRVLLLAAKKVKPHGGKILLSGMSKDVREVFDISGFSSIFDIHDNTTAAVDAAKKIQP